jgi:hypothetical protein
MVSLGDSSGAFVRAYLCDLNHKRPLTAVPQVYGGGVSFVVHPYLWSSNSFDGNSSASAGDTSVSGLSAIFSNCHFIGCSVSSRSISGMNVAYHQHAFLHLSYNTLKVSQARDRR